MVGALASLAGQTSHWCLRLSKRCSRLQKRSTAACPPGSLFRPQALPLGNESSDSWTTWAGCNPSHPTIALETSLLLMRYFRYDFRLKTTWGMPLAIRNLLEASDFGSSVISGRHRRLCRWESWGFLVKTHPHSGQFGTGVGKAEPSWRIFPNFETFASRNVLTGRLLTLRSSPLLQSQT